MYFSFSSESGYIFWGRKKNTKTEIRFLWKSEKKNETKTFELYVWMCICFSKTFNVDDDSHFSVYGVFVITQYTHRNTIRIIAFTRLTSFGVESSSKQNGQGTLLALDCSRWHLMTYHLIQIHKHQTEIVISVFICSIYIIYYHRKFTEAHRIVNIMAHDIASMESLLFFRSEIKTHTVWESDIYEEKKKWRFPSVWTEIYGA